MQSGSPTASTDCGPATLVTGIRYASRHELAQGRERAVRWIARLRDEMTPMPYWPATSLPNHAEAIERSTGRTVG